MQKMHCAVVPAETGLGLAGYALDDQAEFHDFAEVDVVLAVLICPPQRQVGDVAVGIFVVEDPLERSAGYQHSRVGLLREFLLLLPQDLLLADS